MPNNQNLLKFALALTALLPFTRGVDADEPADRSAQRPNIVYILADDMGIGDVQCYNPQGKIPTPNIDRIASEGVRLTNVHTSSSVCTPTRYGILTGRYCWRTWMKQAVLEGTSPALIKDRRETVASFLKSQGYATACVGKWHLGMDWVQNPDETGYRKIAITEAHTRGPLDVGFDYYFGIAGSLNMAPHAFIENRNIQGTMEVLEDPDAVDKRGFIGAKPGWAAKEFVQSEVLPTLAKKTCAWIRDNADQPFFVYMPLNSPHSPIVPSADFAGKNAVGEHGDFCMETDWAVGQVLKTLDELNLRDNTLVIFTADNGTSPKAHPTAMFNKGHSTSGIYRGLKGTLWEGGHRVPFVARWPGTAQAGHVNDDLVCTTDLMATVKDCFGETLAADVGEDSVSFLPCLGADPIPGAASRMVVHHSDRGYFAVTRGKWKLVLHKGSGSGRGTAPPHGPIVDQGSINLFDMETDAVESTNVAAAHPDVVQSLQKELATIIQRGRSTPGPDQPNDLATADWPQIELIRKYLD